MREMRGAVRWRGEKREGGPKNGCEAMIHAAAENPKMWLRDRRLHTVHAFGE